MLSIRNLCGKKHKGTHVIFCEISSDDKWKGIYVYSSLLAALRQLHKYPYILQSLHDSAGTLIASSQKGKVTYHVKCRKCRSI